MTTIEWLRYTYNYSVAKWNHDVLIYKCSIDDENVWYCDMYRDGRLLEKKTETSCTTGTILIC